MSKYKNLTTMFLRDWDEKEKLMKKPTVAVLMSTYNGEKYIREQIDSILAQKDVDITLYIRDDCSTDGTVGIIKDYCSGSRVRLNVGKQNLYAGPSFMKLFLDILANDDHYDFYAFADQDDIWLEEKLISAVRILQEYAAPVLYCSNQTIYRNGLIEGSRHKSTPDLTLVRHITCNQLSGCTMVMNAELAKIIANVKCPDNDFLKKRCHDVWVFLVACVAGRVIYDDNSYILYRIHDNNVVGIREMTFLQKIGKFLNLTAKNLRMQSAECLLEAFPDKLFTDRSYVEDFAYYRKSFKHRMNLIKNAKICKTDRESVLIFDLKILLNYV